ncbi:MAG TPA: 23S rRNA (uracil(1939)-C(5))-methyltransferase RlmD [Armatimonadota bacterium]|jgi:23S rRNA (uracil1939-C5)-methyltransferase
MHIDQSESDFPQLGDRCVVTIETLAAGGDAIARISGFTVFIAGGAPGDVAEIEITQTSKKFARARIVALQTPSPDRVPTPCPLAGGCPGCQLQHLSYAAQLTAKQTFVRDGLERIGHLKGIDVLPTLGMDDPWHYRNKGEFIARIQDDRVELGYHGEDSEAFVPVPDCPIQHPLTMRIVRAVEALATREALPLAQLITRVSPHDGKALAILVCWEWNERIAAVAAALREDVPEVAGVLWSRVRGRSVVRRTLAEGLNGQLKLIQRLGEWDYTVSAESFFQVNNVQATELIRLAGEFVGDLHEATFVDAYCGVGTFLVPLANRALRAMGIEEHPAALQDAVVNLSRYAVRDARLFEGSVETIFTRLVRKGRSVDVALLDPPRKGAGRLALETMAQLGVRRAVLISCDPATFGRDAGDLVSLGYRITAVQPVDMFPQTWHVETMALLERD